MQKEQFCYQKQIYVKKHKNSRKLNDKSFICVFDRGYDDNKIYKYMSDNKHHFVVRLDNEETLLFKRKRCSVRK